MMSDTQSSRMIKQRTSDYLASQIILGVTERMTDQEIKERLDEQLKQVKEKASAEVSKDMFTSKVEI